MKVKITARQVVHYDQIREISEADWERLKQIDEFSIERRQAIQKFTNEAIDPTDILCCDDMENVEIQRLNDEEEPVNDWL